ncbi:MAG: tRNA (adenosine(37)-N6)-dimethylallyltransferase MiaA, partial [bacterium]|nr:tRNA (adenosine(37)-N6)-dimethylallyltransferase MiaA [bacterium]
SKTKQSAVNSAFYLIMLFLPKIIVIVGPTGSGKTDLGIFLAKKFNGEVINADSRQIYRGMDIGTGKPKFETRDYKIKGVKHHLFDIAWPSQIISVAIWKKKAERVIKDILKRGKLPIMVGGTGLYVQALVENLKIPAVPPNQKLREEFGKKTGEQLLSLLKKMDPEAAVKLDPKNPRRIIRALEVSIWSGEPFSKQQRKGEPKYEALELGVFISRDKLYERIDRRVGEMMKMGWLREVEKLSRRYSASTSAMSGIGYQELAHYSLSLPNGTKHQDTKYHKTGRSAKNVMPGDLEKVVQKIKYRVHHYARRQLTWCRRDKNIKWIKTKQEALSLVRKFI